MLIALGGLPGTGKTSIARKLSRELCAVHLRIDSIEQALMRAGIDARDLGSAGYLVGYTVAADNLKLGRLVVADSVNAASITRSAWKNVALESGSQLIEVEIICSNKDEHCLRIEHRVADIPGHKLPTWQEVLSREYEAWESANMTIDTSAVSIDQAVETIVRRLATLR